MVVYTSLFWDLGRLNDHFPEKLANISLPTDYLLEYWGHIRKMLRAAKVSVCISLPNQPGFLPSSNFASSLHIGTSGPNLAHSIGANN